MDRARAPRVAQDVPYDSAQGGGMRSARGATFVEYVGILTMMFVLGAAGSKALGAKLSGGSTNARATIEATVAPTTGDRVGAAPATDRTPVAPTTKARSARLALRGR
jgi:hypothetical protein